MAELAVALVVKDGMDEIEFDEDRSIYLPYDKVTADNVEKFLVE